MSHPSPSRRHSTESPSGSPLPDSPNQRSPSSSFQMPEPPIQKFLSASPPRAPTRSPRRLASAQIPSKPLPAASRSTTRAPSAVELHQQLSHVVPFVCIGSQAPEASRSSRSSPRLPYLPFLLVSLFLIALSNASRNRATMFAAKFLSGATQPGSSYLRVVRVPASP